MKEKEKKFREGVRKMKEMFDAAAADPDFRNSPKFKEYQEMGEKMDELTNRIISPCLDYANGDGEQDDSWPYTIMISLARATCKMLYALQKTGDNGHDVFAFYQEELLPVCKEMAYRECDEMVAAADDEEEEEESGPSFERKKEVILAIADPGMTAEEIVSRHFKKNMTEEERRMVIDYINDVRTNRPEWMEKARRLLEMKKNDETVN